jgi:hypothetical protein
MYNFLIIKKQEEELGGVGQLFEGLSGDASPVRMVLK